MSQNNSKIPQNPIDVLTIIMLECTLAERVSVYHAMIPPHFRESLSMLSTLKAHSTFKPHSTIESQSTFKVHCTIHNRSRYRLMLKELNDNQPPHTKCFTIVYSALPKGKQRFQYLETDNYCDLLGQCIRQMGFNTEGKHRLPSDLGLHIPPFTMKVRGRIIDTPLAIAIMQLDSSPEIQKLGRFIKLMNGAGFNVKYT